MPSKLGRLGFGKSVKRYLLSSSLIGCSVGSVCCVQICQAMSVSQGWFRVLLLPLPLGRCCWFWVVLLSNARNIRSRNRSVHQIQLPLRLAQVSIHSADLSSLSSSKFPAHKLGSTCPGSWGALEWVSFDNDQRRFQFKVAPSFVASYPPFLWLILQTTAYAWPCPMFR